MTRQVSQIPIKEDKVARRRKSGMDELAGLPWQIGIIIGVVAFLAIRVGVPWYFSQSGNKIADDLGKGLADGPLQTFSWIVLALCWIAAGMSYIKQRQRAQLFEAQAKNLQLTSMDWRQFERLVGEWFRRQGYLVDESGGGGPDGGIDLKLRKNGRNEIVQCKQWRARQVPVATVREMWGLLQHHGADAIWIVCIGEFTPDAAAFAVGKPIHLVSGTQLGEMIQARPATPQPSAPPVASAPEPRATACPKCGGAMLVRRNRVTGTDFLGCQAYPKCRGTRALDGSAQT